jgi:hypothetical protein
MFYHLIAATLVALPTIIILVVFLFFFLAIIGASGKSGGNGPGTYVLYFILFFLFIVVPVSLLGFSACMGLFYYFNGDITNAKPYLVFNTTWVFYPVMLISFIVFLGLIYKGITIMRAKKANRLKEEAQRVKDEAQKLKDDKENAIRLAEEQKVIALETEAAKGLRLLPSAEKGILTLSLSSSSYVFNNVTVKAYKTEQDRKWSKWIMEIPILDENHPQNIDFNVLPDNNELSQHYKIEVRLGYSNHYFQIENKGGEIKVLNNSN